MFVLTKQDDVICRIFYIVYRNIQQLTPVCQANKLTLRRSNISHTNGAITKLGIKNIYEMVHLPPYRLLQICSSYWWSRPETEILS